MQKIKTRIKNTEFFKKFKHFPIFYKYSFIFLIILLTLLLPIFTPKRLNAHTRTFVQFNFASPVNSLYIPEPDRETYMVAEENLASYNQEIAEIEEQRKIKDEKISKTLAYLEKVKSPVANNNIASIIVELAEENNADYRVLLAIMTIESGACKQSFSHNCFGYLNGVKYPSYEIAFKDLVPKISRQYASRYGWDFVSLSKAYGQHNWELHSKSMLSVANSI